MSGWWRLSTPSLTWEAEKKDELECEGQRSRCMFECAGLRILDWIYEGSSGISMRGKIYIQALFRVSLCDSWVANISICHPLAFWMDGGGRYEGEEHQLWKSRKLILLPNRRTAPTDRIAWQPWVLTRGLVVVSSVMCFIFRVSV